MAEEKNAPQAAPPVLRPRRRSAWGWVALLTALVLALAAWGAWTRLTSPERVRALLLEAGGPFVNGALEVGEARFRPTRDLRLKDVKVTRKGASVPDIAIDRARVDFNPWAFFGGGAEIRSVTLTRPIVRLAVKKNGWDNMTELFETPAAEAVPTPAEPDGRTLAGGAFVEDGTLEWQDERIFHDWRPRKVEGVFGWWQPSMSTMSDFRFGGTVHDRPFRGVSVTGWAFVNNPWRVRAEGTFDDLNLTSELAAWGPEAIAKRLAPVRLNGRLKGTVTLDFRRQQATDYDVNVRLSGGDFELREPPVLLEETTGLVHVDPEGATVRDFSALIWDGLATGEAVLRFDPRGAIRLRAWARATDVQISTIMSQYMPDREQRPGRLSAAMRFFGDLRRPEKIVAVGTVEMKEAAVMKAPLVGEVFARLNLSLSPSEMIRAGQASVRVDFEQRVVQIERFVVQSANVEVTGQGWLGFDGKLDVVAIVALSRAVKTSGVPILSEVVDFFVGGLQRAVTPPVRVYGDITVRDGIKTQVLPLETMRRPIGDLLELVAAPPPPKREK